MRKFSLHSRLKNHYARWNIRLSDPEQFVKFKNRLLTALNEELEDFLLANNDVDNDFKDIIKAERAESPKVRKSQLYMQPELHGLGAASSLAAAFGRFKFTSPGFGDTAVYREFEATTETRELATVTQILFWALERSSAVESSVLTLDDAKAVETSIENFSPNGSSTTMGSASCETERDAGPDPNLRVVNVGAVSTDAS